MFLPLEDNTGDEGIMDVSESYSRVVIGGLDISSYN